MYIIAHNLTVSPNYNFLPCQCKLADEALDALDARFGELYAENGRPSIPPEQLLRALLLQAF